MVLKDIRMGNSLPYKLAQGECFMDKEILIIKNAAFGYANKPILTKVNFSVFRGNVVGLVGPNGIGKSTMLQTMCGLLPLLLGEIKLEGESITTLGEKGFAGRVAYLRQHNEVPATYTVRELVRTGRYPYMKWWQQNDAAGEAIVDDCMKYMQVEDFQDNLLSRLSGGQKQRVFLAKILAQQTDLLFLDEPTADLDFVFKEELFRFAGQWAQTGKTVVMAVHELGLAYKYCTEILLLRKGGLLAQGKPEQVMTEDNLSASYNASISVANNLVTGGLDVCAKSAKETVEQKELLAKICKKQK